MYCNNHVSTTLKLKRSRLKNKANKTQLPSDKQNYEKQRNLITTLNKQFKKEYFENIEDNTHSKALNSRTSVSHISQISTSTVTLTFC